ncbi:hypothetical protein FOXYS1_4769, partial [Fusarium oxysporum]
MVATPRQHHIERKLRKESLFDLWRKILGKKQPQDDKKGPTLPAKYGKCQKVVGYGTSDIVHGSHKKMENGINELYAVKELQHRSREMEDEYRYIRGLTAEFCILNELLHPNVISMLEPLTGAKGNYCQVMEYCEGGDLFTLVYSAGHGRLKISDIGNSDCFRMAWENDVHMMSGLCGTGTYIAPEVYMNQEYDGREVDVWDCGVIYTAMRTGVYLWHEARKDEDKIFAQYLKDRRQEEGFSPIESLKP